MTASKQINWSHFTCKYPRHVNLTLTFGNWKPTVYLETSCTSRAGRTVVQLESLVREVAGSAGSAGSAGILYKVGLVDDSLTSRSYKKWSILLMPLQIHHKKKIRLQGHLDKLAFKLNSESQNVCEICFVEFRSVFPSLTSLNSALIV
jgi:hypothetical protein